MDACIASDVSVSQELFAEGKGLGERALGIRNDDIFDVIDNVFVVNTVVD